MRQSTCVVWMVACCVLAWAAMPASAQLVGLWRFDEGSGTTAADESDNALDGTLTGLTWDGAAYVADAGELPTWTTGVYGGALSFSSDLNAAPYAKQSVRVPFDSVMNVDTEMTVMAWCRYDSNGTGNFLVGAGSTSTYPTWLFRFDSYYFQWRAQSDANFYAWDGVSAGFRTGLACPDAVVDTWQHVAVVVGGGQTKLYIDGVLQDTKAITSGPTVNSADLVIGSNDFQSRHQWNGELDDVALFNAALTEAEIADCMSGDFSAFTTAGPIDPPEGDIVGLWRFNEGSGTTAADDTVHGNDGTLNGYIGEVGSETSDPSGYPTWIGGPSGAYGTALQFTPGLTATGPSPVVEVPEDDVMDLVNQFSFACWAKFDSDGAGAPRTRYGQMFTKRGAYYFQGSDQPADNDLYVWNEYGIPGINTGITGPVVLDAWAHYAYVFDNGTLTLYINGVQADQVTGIAGRPSVGDDGVIMGRDVFRNGYDGRDFSGALDDVALFNYPLTEAEVNLAMSGDFSPWLLAQLPTETTVVRNVVEGSDVTLTVPYPGTAGDGDFTWTFTPAGGGAPQVLAGENDATLFLENVQSSDSGSYVASYDNGAAKVAATYTVTLNVVLGLPVAGVVGFGAIALGLAVAGAQFLRRKK